MQLRADVSRMKLLEPVIDRSARRKGYITRVPLSKPDEGFIRLVSSVNVSCHHENGKKHSGGYQDHEDQRKHSVILLPGYLSATGAGSANRNLGVG